MLYFLPKTVNIFTYFLFLYLQYICRFILAKSFNAHLKLPVWSPPNCNSGRATSQTIVKVLSTNTSRIVAINVYDLMSGLHLATKQLFACTL